ncbi:unnamed protein product [Spodoptera exigua]|nr:unnamed protein product [Spodoptera exigua]
MWFTNRAFKNSAQRYRRLRLCLQTDRRFLIILMFGVDHTHTLIFSQGKCGLW